MKKKTLIISIISIFSGGLFLAAGCGNHTRHSYFHGSAEKKAEWVVKKISRELDLNDGQKQKLEQIKKEVLAKKDKLHGNKKEMIESVLEQVKSESFDEEKMNALIADKEANMKEMRKFLVSKFSEFHATLTPEQRQTLAAKISEFHEEFH